MIAETAQIANEAAQAAEKSGVLGSLGINYKLLLAQLVNFAIVVFVMWKWVYTPLIKMMDKRAKEIDDGLGNAKLAERRLNEAAAEKESLLKEARVDAHAMLDDAESKAEALRRDKMAQTKEEIGKVAEEAKHNLEQERVASYGALQTDVATLISNALEKIGTELDEKTQRDMIRKALEELKKA